MTNFNQMMSPSTDVSGVTMIHKLPGDLVDQIVLQKHQMEWMEEPHRNPIGDIVEYNSLDMLKWGVTTQGYHWGDSTIIRIAKQNNFEMLKWALANGCPWHTWTPNTILEQDNLEILKWVVTNGYECLRFSDPMKRVKSLKMLRWVVGNGYKLEKYDSQHLVKLDDPNGEMLKWALTNGCSWYEWATNDIVEQDNLDLLKWAVVNGYPLNNPIGKAKSVGMLRWLLDNGCVWEELTGYQLVANCMDDPEFEALKWAYANGCPWHPDTMGRMGFLDRLDMLKWALQHGLEWGSDSARSILSDSSYGEKHKLSADSFDIWVWALNNGCKITENRGTFDALYHPRNTRHLDIAEKLGYH